ncbi:MAG: thiol reductant ABC exporter subunit CydC [Thermoleophilia bacterium]
MSTLLELLRIVRLPRLRVAASVALGSLAVLAGVGLMAFAGYLISRSAERPPVLSLTVVIVAVRFFGLARPLTRYLERLTSHDLAFRLLARMRVAFFTRLEPLVPARVEGYRKGDLLARMVGDVDALQNLFLRGLTPPLVALLAGAVSVAVCVAFLPAAGLVLAAGLLAGGVVVPIVAAAAGRRSGARQAGARAELTVELVELLRGAPELVVLGADRAALARVAALDAELTHLARREALATGLVEGLGVAVVGLTVAGVLLVCIAATAAGALDRVLVATLALLAMASFEAVAPLPAAALRLQTTLDSGRRLLAIASREPAVTDPARPAPLSAGSGVALEKVGFAYGGDESWDLRGVDLRIAPGRRVALVGRSGAGKSTVAALLVRFLDPGEGRVALGGVDLCALRQRDVRSRVTLDSQDAYLFSTTIRENVRLARPEASDAEIEQALQRARAWQWVGSLPGGLDTFVGEEGESVSGGERRRIALARTFLAGAPVIVLDEPTGHLDPETAEDLIGDALRAADSRSVLLITHRPEGLDSVDEVITLHRGRVVSSRPAQGSPAQA